jgi:hypothetical protein
VWFLPSCTQPCICELSPLCVDDGVPLVNFAIYVLMLDDSVLVNIAMYVLIWCYVMARGHMHQI